MLDAMSNWALTSLMSYGFPILLFVSYIGSLGIPFPITLVIVAAGAFTRQGLMDWRLAFLACLVGASLADNSEYLLGRLAQPWLIRRFGKKAAWKQAQKTINRQGGWAILLTRFWLTPLAPAVNMISGSRYPYLRFLLFDLSGELLWVPLYGGLGYAFASQWQIVSQKVSQFSTVSYFAAVLGLAIYYLIKRLRNSQQQRATSCPQLIILRPPFQSPKMASASLYVCNPHLYRKKSAALRTRDMIDDIEEKAQ